MKKLFLLVLIVVIVGGLLPQNRPALAQEGPGRPAAPSVNAAKACLVKTVYFNYLISGVIQMRYWQRVNWCYNGARILNFTATRSRNDYSSFWNFYQYHPFVYSGNINNAVAFLGSVVFRGNSGGVWVYWQPYIFQRITNRGGYFYDGWSWSW